MNDKERTKLVEKIKDKIIHLVNYKVIIERFTEEVIIIIIDPEHKIFSSVLTKKLNELDLGFGYSISNKHIYVLGYN